MLDVLPNGSGFVRADAFRHAPDDVYVSPAQIRRCELRTGDEVAGPVRPPRRSERYPSLVRVEMVNGAPAEPPAERPLFSELTPAFARERLEAPEELAAAPFGKGSRVAVTGPPGAGATMLLRRIAATLAERHPDVELTVVLAGARPEELGEWRSAVGAPVVGGSFDESPERQGEDASIAVERAKRAAERGGDAAVVIDSLDHLPQNAARRVFGAARNTEEAGSVTVIAAAGLGQGPSRHATTRIVLRPGGELALDPEASGTLRADLLS
jgi:transcription termination factor Rho